MIPFAIPWGLVARAAVVAALLFAVFLGYRLVAGKVDDYVETKKALEVEKIAKAEAEARGRYLEQSLKDAEKFADQRNAIQSSAAGEIAAARQEAAEWRLSYDQLKRISETPRGNQALSYRAKQRTKELFRALESESAWFSETGGYRGQGSASPEPPGSNAEVSE